MGTGASLYRRGTHVLLVNNRPQFYLESREVSLQEYEGMTAVIRGEVTPNTHETFLPVFQVAEVTPLGGQPISDLEKYNIPSFGLSLEAPAEWVSTLTASRLAFTVESSSTPIVEIEAKALPKIPEGLAIRIGGRNGVRIVEEGTGKHFLYVEREAGSVILFTFTPQGEDGAALRDVFYALIRSVRFKDSEASASTPFIPCGGSAHVLCPAGMYCEVRELDTGIGACRPLGP